MRNFGLIFLALFSFFDVHSNTSPSLSIEKLSNDPMVESRVLRLSEELGVEKASLEEFFTDISEVQRIEASGRVPKSIAENINFCLSSLNNQVEGRDLVLQCFGSFYAQWDHEIYQSLLVQLWQHSKFRKNSLSFKSLKLTQFLASQVSDRLHRRFDSKAVFYRSSLFYKQPGFEFKGIDLKELQNGDVLLVSSANPKAQLNTIPFVEFNRFTHAMTFLRDPDGSEYFIEAEASLGTAKTKAVERKKYFSAQTHVLVLRFLASPAVIDQQTRFRILEEFRSRLNSKIGSPYNLSLDSIEGPQKGFYTCTELIRESFLEAFENVVPEKFKYTGGIRNTVFPESFSSFSEPLVVFAKTLDMNLNKTFSPDDIIETSAFQIVGEVVRHNLSFKTFIDRALVNYIKDGLAESAAFMGNSDFSSNVDPKVNLVSLAPVDSTTGFDMKSLDPKLAALLRSYLDTQGIHLNENNEIDAEKSLVEFLTFVEKKIILQLKKDKKDQVAFILPGEIESALNKEEDQNPVLRAILKSPLFSKKIMGFMR